MTREFHGVKEVRVHTDLPKWAYVQALLARGDRRVGDILLPPTSTAGTGPSGKARSTPTSSPCGNATPTNSSPGTSSTTACKKDYLWEEYQRALEEKGDPALPAAGVQEVRHLSGEKERSNNLVARASSPGHLRRRHSDSPAKPIGLPQA